jgi:hypothetical protein
VSTNPITANFTESKDKPRRGRPSKFSEEEIAICESLALFTSKSRRGRENVLYRQRAISIIGHDDARLKWLFDEAAIWRGEGKWKPSILSELGRIDDHHNLRVVALAICEAKPSTTQAVEMIRNYRTGKVKTADEAQLADMLIGTINRYLRSFPTTTQAQIKTALSSAISSVETGWQE